MNLSDTDKAYLAGFIDADGSIYTGSKGTLAIVEIVQSDKPFLEYLQRKINTGNIYQKPRGEKWQKRDCYQLRITGKSALALLIELKDFLIIKKDRAVGILND